MIWPLRRNNGRWRPEVLPDKETRVAGGLFHVFFEKKTCGRSRGPGRFACGALLAGGGLGGCGRGRSFSSGHGRGANAQRGGDELLFLRLVGFDRADGGTGAFVAAVVAQERV